MNRKNIERIILAVLVAAMVIVVPMLFSGYKLKVVNISLIYSLLSLSMCIMLGMGGQMSFAPLGFMGLGAYIVANLTTGRLKFMSSKVHPIPATLIAMVAVCLFAFGLGLILLRLKGVFFTFSTIAFIQVLFSFYSQYRPLFGGPDGISGVPKLSVGGFKFDSAEKWFYLMMVVVVIFGLITERIRNTKFGRSLACIRDNNTAAMTLGVDTYMTRVYAFVMQAAISSLAGALYALVSGYVGADMFAYNRSTLTVVMVMLGGINSTIGCIAGAFIVNVLPEILRSAKEYLNLLFGLLVILLMIFMPDGIAGLVRQIRHRLNKAGKKPEKGGASA